MSFWCNGTIRRFRWKLHCSSFLLQSFLFSTTRWRKASFLLFLFSQVPAIIAFLLIACFCNTYCTVWVFQVSSIPWVEKNTFGCVGKNCFVFDVRGTVCLKARWNMLDEDYIIWNINLWERYIPPQDQNSTCMAIFHPDHRHKLSKDTNGSRVMSKLCMNFT